MRLRLYAAVFAAALAIGCAGNAPASLSPAGVKLWQANQAVLAVNLVQSTAINLNAAVPPLLSERNTRIVGEAANSARRSIEKVPDGWRPTVVATLQQIRDQLDAQGKQAMGAWLDVAATMVKEIK
jgi:hypothetical protein